MTSQFNAVTSASPQSSAQRFTRLAFQVMMFMPRASRLRNSTLRDSDFLRSNCVDNFHAMLFATRTLISRAVIGACHFFRRSVFSRWGFEADGDGNVEVFRRLFGGLSRARGVDPGEAGVYRAHAVEWRLFQLARRRRK